MASYLILYVGHERGRIAYAATVAGHQVITVETMMQALGVYITCMPHVTIIDSTVPFAPKVYAHLRSVDAAPILMLEEGDSYTNDGADSRDGVYHVSRTLSPAQMIAAAVRAAAG